MCSNARGSASKQWVRQFVLVIVYLSIVLLISLPIASCLESKLYPFDVNDDLSTVPKDDGGSPLITLDVDFPFFGTNYRELYVSSSKSSHSSRSSRIVELYISRISWLLVGL